MQISKTFDDVMNAETAEINLQEGEKIRIQTEAGQIHVGFGYTQASVTLLAGDNYLVVQRETSTIYGEWISLITPDNTDLIEKYIANWHKENPG